jgi:hypothetical protein
VCIKETQEVHDEVLMLDDTGFLRPRGEMASTAEVISALLSRIKGRIHHHREAGNGSESP